MRLRGLFKCTTQRVCVLIEKFLIWERGDRTDGAKCSRIIKEWNLEHKYKLTSPKGTGSPCITAGEKAAHLSRVMGRLVDRRALQ